MDRGKKIALRLYSDVQIVNKFSQLVTHNLDFKVTIVVNIY